MSPFFEKALKSFHDTADRDKDGKITKQDAAIILGQLQAEATGLATRATPLGAIAGAGLFGFALGVIAHIGWVWVAG